MTQACNITNKGISIFDAASTLTETRRNTEIANVSKISYYQVTAWCQEKERAHHALFIMEYYKRINKEAEAKLMEELGLKADMTEEMLTTLVFPKKIVKDYLSSSIEWKREVMEDFLCSNSALLEKQIELVNMYINAKKGESYAKERYNPFDSGNNIQIIAKTSDTSHL